MPLELNPELIVFISIVLAYAWWTWFLTRVVGAPGWESKKEWTIIPMCWWGGPVMWVFAVLCALAVAWFRIKHGYWK